MTRQCSKCKHAIGGREGWTRVEGMPIHRTCMKGIVPRLTVRLKADLSLVSVAGGRAIEYAGTVLTAYKSPGYLSSHRPSWLVEVKGFVIELFPEDVELMTVEHVDASTVPALIKAYTVPDHRGFTTLPYQKE